MLTEQETQNAVALIEAGARAVAAAKSLEEAIGVLSVAVSLIGKMTSPASTTETAVPSIPATRRSKSKRG